MLKLIINGNSMDQDMAISVDSPTNRISVALVKEELSKVNVKRSPGHDCISGITIISLSLKAFFFLTLTIC